MNPQSSWTARPGRIGALCSTKWTVARSSTLASPFAPPAALPQTLQEKPSIYTIWWTSILTAQNSYLSYGNGHAENNESIFSSIEGLRHALWRHIRFRTIGCAIGSRPLNIDPITAIFKIYLHLARIYTPRCPAYPSAPKTYPLWIFEYCQKPKMSKTPPFWGPFFPDEMIAQLDEIYCTYTTTLCLNFNGLSC